MMRLMRTMVMVTAGALLAGSAGAQGDKATSNKEIMVKLNKGDASLCPVIGKELKEATPPWETLQKQTKEFAELAEAMAKNKPTKGELASWQKLTKAYAADAKALDEAAQKKDKPAAVAAHGKLVKSCRACHVPHRPAKK